MVQIGLRGPEADEWYFKARTMANKEFYLDHEGKPCEEPPAPYTEAETERDLGQESWRRRRLYEHDNGVSIKGVSFEPA